MKNIFTVVNYNDKNYKVCKDNNDNVFVIDNDIDLEYNCYN